MKTIYIAGFEPTADENHENNVAGWEWRPKKADRDKIYEQWKANGGGYYIYKGEILVEDEASVDETTAIVEEYLHTNDFENAFPEHKILV